MIRGESARKLANHQHLQIIWPSFPSLHTHGTATLLHTWVNNRSTPFTEKQTNKQAYKQKIPKYYLQMEWNKELTCEDLCTVLAIAMGANITMDTVVRRVVVNQYSTENGYKMADFDNVEMVDIVELSSSQWWVSQLVALEFV